MKRPDFKVNIIEASAGTGKTYRITEEFFRLIDKDNPARSLNKMMALTFSEKAAIEMKTRILSKIYSSILDGAEPWDRIFVENALFRLRISTIHSFCQKSLRRFSFFLGVDPFFRVMDSGESSMLFGSAIGKFMVSARGRSSALEILDKMKFKDLFGLLTAMKESHPYVFAGYTDLPLTEKVAVIYRQVSEIYQRSKIELSSLDFDDLEKMTYKMVREIPEAIVMLEDFDEKIDNIFVDEFQDTNLIQWRIITKLLEEWLSGYGARAEYARRYGVFIVGDRKQSIYRFRGAESSIFDDAKKALIDYCNIENLSINYRSAGGIIDFINRVFESTPPWPEQPLVSGLQKEIDFAIEINIADCGRRRDASAEGLLKEEYMQVINKINQMIEENVCVWDNETKKSRPIEFRDIAVLMRKRSGDKFRIFEDMLKSSRLPFVILGGIGFYQEPEVIFLLSLIFALADSSDKLSLWNLKNSVYSISIQDIRRWQKFLEWEGLSSTVEKILREEGFWLNLSNQQKANAEKFLMIIEGLEYMPLFQLARTMRDFSKKHDEPKADVFSAGQNAIKVLTVHSSKGLEFPAVFLINIEDGSYTARDKIIYIRDEESNIAPYRYGLNSEADGEFKGRFKDMMEEEEKRVLYVALTRAGQYLYISGIKKRRGSCWLECVEKFKDEFPVQFASHHREPASEDDSQENIEYGHLSSVPEDFTYLTSFTREQQKNYYGAGEAITGKILHKLLYEIWEGTIPFESEQFGQRSEFYSAKLSTGCDASLKSFMEETFESIASNNKLFKIITEKQQGKVFAELPFLFEEGDKIYEGSIDKLIIHEDTCSIYEYKTGKSSMELHKRQLALYEKAAVKIFSPASIKKYVIVFPQGDIIKVL